MLGWLTGPAAAPAGEDDDAPIAPKKVPSPVPEPPPPKMASEPPAAALAVAATKPAGSKAVASSGPPSGSSHGSTRAKTDRTADRKETAELKELFGRRTPSKLAAPTAKPGMRSPSKSPPRPKPTSAGGASSAGEGSPSPQSSTLSYRPKWDNKPLTNPPGSLNGVRPITREPWMEIAHRDLAMRMEFGSRDALGLPEYEDGSNGLILEAKDRRKALRSARPWNSSVVKHEPPALRGQKVLRRTEPWSEYHNDSIDELNAIDDSSVNELYEITADRDNGVKPTIVQPAWDSSQKFGRKSKPVGGDLETKLRAQTFRDQRRAFTRAGAPMNRGPGGSSIAPHAHGERFA